MDYIINSVFLWEDKKKLNKNREKTLNKLCIGDDTKLREKKIEIIHSIIDLFKKKMCKKNNKKIVIRIYKMPQTKPYCNLCN